MVSALHLKHKITSWAKKAAATELQLGGYNKSYFVICCKIEGHTSLFKSWCVAMFSLYSRYPHLEGGLRLTVEGSGMIVTSSHCKQLTCYFMMLFYNDLI